jgi:hypothetical protein
VSASVTCIGVHESVPDFIRRHGGVSNTCNIAARFGWDMRDARRKLSALERAGEIERAGIAPMGWGSAQNWIVR